MFINDLAKSSVHCIVKEAALFTLGIIIESNGNKNNTFSVSECIMAPCHYFCLVSQNEATGLSVRARGNKGAQLHSPSPDLINALLICAHRCL